MDAGDIQLWRERLEAYLGGPRLARRERALKRDPADYFLDTRNIARIPECDIAWLFRTLELGVLQELPDGDFLTPRRGAKESLYWHGSSSQRPTPVSVPIEVVISLGAIGRLIDEFGWPPDCLGSQNGKWGFDVTGYAQGSDRILLQCEVKTRPGEIDRMCAYVVARLHGLDTTGLATASQRANWDKKIDELLAKPPKVLWALGPGGYGRVYRVTESQAGDLRLLPGQTADLGYPANP
ncbi:hypothetical protein [Defluviimonas salinarum]|uniref:PD-(D/E)XK nuclease superfamily protein n=1 Tax=Defluviimonas salinarum TaxID=2992147 RepID=A0ABT3J945_9RHOB|nr:hypothetical protein [Defluviimonas salinarum]MCW3784197.1 hypothetical protein [Defluviimonas salinarum]